MTATSPTPKTDYDPSASQRGVGIAREHTRGVLGVLDGQVADVVPVQIAQGDGPNAVFLIDDLALFRDP